MVPSSRTYISLCNPPLLDIDFSSQSRERFFFLLPERGVHCKRVWLYQAWWFRHCVLPRWLSIVSGNAFPGLWGFGYRGSNGKSYSFRCVSLACVLDSTRPFQIRTGRKAFPLVPCHLSEQYRIHVSCRSGDILSILTVSWCSTSVA